MCADTSFGHASGDTVISSGSDVWAVADGFVKIKILRLLIELDLYETIAKFGYKDNDDMYYNRMEIPERRIEAVNRVIFYLRQLIGNCEFVVKKGQKQMLSSMVDRIEQVEKVVKGIYHIYYNDITKEDKLEINEEHFKVCFDILKNIKDDLNQPLNEAGLIFRKTDEIDVDKIMKEIIGGG
jgi:hypothetical protein